MTSTGRATQLLELLEGCPPRRHGAGPAGLPRARRADQQHPDWRADVLLEPLAGDEVALVESLAGETPPAVRDQLARISAGNPLFAEELVAMLPEAGGDVDTLELPTSLQALLGARLDQLEPEARDSLERGAIEGELFHRGAVIDSRPPRRVRRSRTSSPSSFAATSCVSPMRASRASPPSGSSTSSCETRRTGRQRRHSAPSCTSGSPTGSSGWPASERWSTR
jgi:hypothetical protein